MTTLNVALLQLAGVELILVPNACSLDPIRVARPAHLPRLAPGSLMTSPQVDLPQDGDPTIGRRLTDTG